MLSAHLWYQSSDREIPGTMLSTEGTAKQFDRAFRGLIQWKRIGQKSTTQVRQAYFGEFQRYRDRAILLDDTTDTHTLLTDLQHHLDLSSRMRWSMGAAYTLSRVSGDNLLSKQRHQGALFTALLFRMATLWELKAALRQEWVERGVTPFTPSLGLSYNPFSWLRVQGNISYNYRLPTFNDRYWRPGGNPDLSPEKGWTEELGVQITPFTDIDHMAVRITAFNSRIKDWIQWLPVGGNWSPVNSKKVWTRGLELGLKSRLQFRKFYVMGIVNYSYTRSTNEDSYLEDEASIGKQLLYVPEHNGNLRLEVGNKRAALYYTHGYTGENYATADHSPFSRIDAFDLASLGLRINYPIKKIRLGLQGRINNLWDADYQVIQYRPMPGRNYELSIQIQFIH